MRFSDDAVDRWLEDRTINKVREEFVPLSRLMRVRAHRPSRYLGMSRPLLNLVG